MASTPNTMIRSSSGTLYFDALLHADHTSSVTPTQHPVQTGAAISDHAYVEPKEISLEVGMTDVVGGDGSSVRAYQSFQALMQKREPCTVVTRLGTYSNMLLTSISVPDDYTTMFGLRCTLIFTEIRIVSVAVVQVQQSTSGSKTPTAPPSAPAPTQTAEQTPVKTQTAATSKGGATKKQSVLKQAVDAAKKATSPTKAGTTPKPSVKVAKVTPNAVAKVAAITGAKMAVKATTSKATMKPVKAIASAAARCTSRKPNAPRAIALFE